MRAVNAQSTGVALIFVNAEGENVIGIHAGANAALSVEQVEAEKARIAGAQALLMQLESPLESVLAAAKSPISIRPPLCSTRHRRVTCQMSCFR